MSTFPGGFVPVAPPADGLRLAFVAARRRRNTKAGASGAAGLLALMLVLTSVGGGGDRTLLQEPLPPATTNGGSLGIVGGTEPVSEASAPAAPTTATSLTVGRPPTAPRGAVPMAGAATPAAEGTTQSGSSGRVQAASSGPVTGPMTRTETLAYTNGDPICPARKQQEGARFCINVSAFSSSDGTTRITADICNVSTASETLTYDSARELDIAVRQAGEEYWRWSVGRHFAATPHSLALPVGECLSWQTTWRQVDTRGVPVPAGNYSVLAEFDAQQLPSTDRRTTAPLTVSRP